MHILVMEPLDTRFFESVREERVGGNVYTAYRPIGAPIILSSKKDGSPLASLHMQCNGFQTKARALFHANPKEASSVRTTFQPHFGGLINTNHQAFSFIITNLACDGYLAFAIVDYEPGEENDPNRKVRNPINLVNLLKPGQSYVVRGDQNTGKTFVLNAVEDAVTGEKTKVKDDEKAFREGKSAKTEGTYYRVVVVPQQGCDWQKEKFKEGVEWRTRDMICVRTGQSKVSDLRSRLALLTNPASHQPVAPGLASPTTIGPYVRSGLTGCSPASTKLFQKFNIPTRLREGEVEILETTRLPDDRFKVQGNDVCLLSGNTKLTAEYMAAFEEVCPGVPFDMVDGEIHITDDIPLSEDKFTTRPEPTTRHIETICARDGGGDSSSDEDMGMGLFGGAPSSSTFGEESSSSSDEDMGGDLFGGGGGSGGANYGTEILSGSRVGQKPTESRPKDWGTEGAEDKATDVRGESLVSDVSGGETYVQEKVVDVENLDFDYDNMSKFCTFSLSVAPSLVFASSPTREQLEQWAKDLLQKYNREDVDRYLAKLDRVYKAETCCICLEEDSPPNQIFYQCGHACCHQDCAKTLTTCPFCRAFIVAKLPLSK